MIGDKSMDALKELSRNEDKFGDEMKKILEEK